MLWSRKSILETFILLTIIVFPFSAVGSMAVSPMSPMHTWPERCGNVTNCVENCRILAQANFSSRKSSSSGASAGKCSPGCSPSQCKSILESGMQETITQCILSSNGRVSGIRRIYPKNVLEHPQRKAVYDTIVANPGVDMGKIGKLLEVNRETLRYHIDLLETSKKIVVIRDRGITRYFENHGRYGLLERRVLAYLWNPTAKQILSIIFSRPGITQTDIAIMLSVASPTVYWHIQRLAGDGILTSEREGRLIRYRINPEPLQILAKPAAPQESIQPVLYT